VDDNHVNPLYKHVFPSRCGSSTFIHQATMEGKCGCKIANPSVQMQFVCKLAFLTKKGIKNREKVLGTISSRWFAFCYLNSKASGLLGFYQDGSSSHQKMKWWKMWKHLLKSRGTWGWPKRYTDNFSNYQVTSPSGVKIFTWLPPYYHVISWLIHLIPL
jgi:hypothetical protein